MDKDNLCGEKIKSYIVPCTSYIPSMGKGCAELGKIVFEAFGYPNATRLSNPR